MNKDALLDPDTVRAALDDAASHEGVAHAVATCLHEGDTASLRAFFDAHQPADIASALGGLSAADALFALRLLDPKEQALVFGYLPPEFQVRLAELMGRRDLAAIMAAMSHDERADLFNRLEPAQQEALLPGLAQAEREDLRKLASYPEGTVGSAMTSDYATLAPEMTARQAIDALRLQAPDSETIYQAYIVDAERRLVGTVSLRELLVARPSERVAEIMETHVVSVRAEAPREEAAALVSRYDLIALPVVNGGARLIGIVTVDDVIDAIVQEGTEDVQRFGGVEALREPYMRIGFATMIRKRAGWLSALFLSEMLTASAMQHFEGELEKAIVLTLFIPLIMSSGGNSGSQATSLIIRALALREVRLRDWWRVVLRELPSGVVLGAILGAIGFARIALWQVLGFYDYGEHWMLVAATVAAALVGIVTFGSLSGAMLPFVLQRLGFDPASASAPFVATLVDVTGLVIYFSVAYAVLHGTLL